MKLPLLTKFKIANSMGSSHDPSSADDEISRSSVRASMDLRLVPTSWNVPSVEQRPDDAYIKPP